MKRELAKRDDLPVRRAVAEAIEQHRAAGREVEAGGVRSFVREQGDGDPVVLMHGIRRLWVMSTRPPVARWLFYMQGIADRSATPAHEVDAHLALLHRDDSGRAFQRIVRGFEANAEKERLYLGGLRESGWPAQVV